MGKRITIAVVAAVLVASLTAWAFAEGSFSGKVTKIEGERITITVDGPVPAWARAGVVVKAGDGAPEVVRARGNEVTLRFGKEKAAKIKPDSILTVTESAGEELQGC